MIKFEIPILTEPITVDENIALNVYSQLFDDFSDTAIFTGEYDCGRFIVVAHESECSKSNVEYAINAAAAYVDASTYLTVICIKNGNAAIRPVTSEEYVQHMQNMQKMQSKRNTSMLSFATEQHEEVIG